MTWQATNRSSSAGAIATTAVGLGPNPTYQTRLRAIYCTLVGTNAGSGTVVVRDGPTGTGSIIFQSNLNIPANSQDIFSRSDLDLRATIGNVMTIEFLAGTPGDFQTVNALGDYVPLGTPYGATLLGE